MVRRAAQTRQLPDDKKDRGEWLRLARLMGWRTRGKQRRRGSFLAENS